jgi:hypothetical protein
MESPWREQASGILKGAPDQEGDVPAQATQKSTQGTRATTLLRWTFTAPHREEHWLFCTYGSVPKIAPVRMARHIPAHLAECTATVVVSQDRREPTVFVCR